MQQGLQSIGFDSSLWLKVKTSRRLLLFGLAPAEKGDLTQRGEKSSLSVLLLGWISELLLLGLAGTQLAVSDFVGSLPTSS